MKSTGVQLIALRYERGEAARDLGGSELRAAWLTATRAARLPLSDGRGGVTMGPSLPKGVTSDCERALLELAEARDPEDVRTAVDAGMPAGVRVLACWRPSRDDTRPHDEAMYTLEWSGAPDAEKIRAALAALMAKKSLTMTRAREGRTQTIDARALIRSAWLENWEAGTAHIVVVVAVGPEGALRPDELMQAAGFVAGDGAWRAHRVGLQRAEWRGEMQAEGGSLRGYPTGSARQAWRCCTQGDRSPAAATGKG